MLDSCPTNEGPAFAIAGLAPEARATFEVPTSTGRVYSLLACTNLPGGEWSSVTNQPGTGETMGLVDEAPGEGVNAYRVAVALPE